MIKKNHALLSNNLKRMAFDPEHLLFLPGHVYWKDKNSIHLGYNDYGAQCLGFASGDEIVGRTLADIFSPSIAAELRKNDQKVIKSKKQIFIHEQGTLKDNQSVIFVSYKMPLFDDNESVIGILGLSFTRAPDNFSPAAQLAQDFNYPQNARQSKPLSKMENACLDLICRGLTAKQIARELKLSPKTVETYTERAKFKFNAKNKAELIWKILNISGLAKIKDENSL